MWWALIWNNIESYDYNNYDDNKDFDGYEGFDDFDDIINQEGGIQIYMFEPFASDCGKNGCRIYWSLTCPKIYYVFLGISSKKYLQGWTRKKNFFVVLYSLLWKEGRKNLAVWKRRYSLWFFMLLPEFDNFFCPSK